MIRVLNLYAGIGGNRKFWKNVKVTAVESNPEIAKIYQRFYPDDEVIVSDAHKYLLEHFEEFDFIWSSPPCQSHSKLNRCNRRAKICYPCMELYEEIILLRTYFKGLWVVENVVPYYGELIPAYKAGRHLFWSNFFISNKDVKFPGNVSHANKKQLMEWLEMFFEENIYYNGNHDNAQILRNAVHPKLGEHVFECAFRNTTTNLRCGKTRRWLEVSANCHDGIPPKIKVLGILPKIL